MPPSPVEVRTRLASRALSPSPCGSLCRGNRLTGLLGFTNVQELCSGGLCWAPPDAAGPGALPTDLLDARDIDLLVARTSRQTDT